MDLSFEQLVRGDICGPEVIWLHPKKIDIGGGRIEKDDIDQLASHPEAQVVRIMGLRQDTFEYFIQTYGRQLRIIEFFKNKLVEDWSLLGRSRRIIFSQFLCSAMSSSCSVLYVSILMLSALICCSFPKKSSLLILPPIQTYSQ